MINKGERLRELRLLHGMTQKDFAGLLQIPQPYLSAIERGRKPADAIALRACYVFKETPAFFETPSAGYGSGTLNFRTKRIPARVQDAARVTFAELEREARHRYRGTRNINLAFPNLEDRSMALDIKRIEEIADHTRKVLDLPTSGPVINVTRALERAGTPVVELINPHVDLTSIDGLSSPSIDEDRGVIATTPKEDGGRVRFTRAHELGHLVMHTSIRPGSEKVREDEANLFAGAFLMPKADAEEHLTSTLTLEGYAQVKAKYAVSIQALIRRAKELGIINQERYRSLSIQVSSRGWRTNEPVFIAVEKISASPTGELFTKSDSQKKTHAPVAEPQSTFSDNQEADVIPLFRPNN